MDYTIKSLVKAFEILESIAEKPATASELATRLGINKSTLHRFLYTLEQQNYIEKSLSETYHLSHKFIQLGLSAQNSIDLIRVAKPYLSELSRLFEESCLLACFEKYQVFYMDKVESPYALRIVLGPGQRVPLYSVASGKLFLSDLPLSQLEMYLEENELKPFTKNTITSKEQLLRELAKVRENGYAVDNEEYEIGLRGVSAPVRNYTGRVVAALSVAGVSIRLNKEKTQAVISTLVEMTAKMSKHLGFAEHSVVNK